MTAKTRRTENVLWTPKTSFVVRWDGYDQVFNPGMLFAEEDPFVQEHRDKLRPAAARPLVEAATANPGEQR